MPSYPKPKRETNRALLDEVKARKVCIVRNMYGECYGDYDPHHIRSVGSGGSDTPDNVCCLCRRHHTLAHSGKIPKSVLYELNYEYIERLAQD